MKEMVHMEPIKILLADDDKEDAFFFAKALKVLPIATELMVVKDGEKLIIPMIHNK